MNREMMLFISARVIILVIGLSLYLPILADYIEFVNIMRDRGRSVPNFWYWSPDYAFNVTRVIQANFILFLLVLYPIFAPKSLGGNIFALPGFYIGSYGYSLMTSVLPTYQMPDTYAMGLIIFFAGIMLITIGFYGERDRWSDSGKQKSSKYKIKKQDKRDTGIELV